MITTLEQKLETLTDDSSCDACKAEIKQYEDAILIILNQTEINPIIDVLENGRRMLKDSTVVRWSKGDLEVWSDWANKMRTTINSFISMTDHIVKIGK